MAAFLSRLGRLAARRRRTVLVTWLLVFAALCVGGFGFGGPFGDSFTIPGTESQRALDRLDAVFPQTAGASAQVIVVDPGGRIDRGEARATVERLVRAVKGVDGIEAATSPFSRYSTRAISKDHRAAVVSVQFTDGVSRVTGQSIDALVATGRVARAGGLRASFSGAVFEDRGVGTELSEGLGVLFAGVVLVITFGSLLAAGMPLVIAIVGVVLSLAAIRIAALVVPVSSSAPTLALMLGLAVGIDYGLFIVSRHREQLATGMSVEESLPTAVGTAGTAVVFAGVTVVIALLGLLVVGIPFLSVMGVGAAFAVLVSVAASVTLLPAVLAFGGERFAPRRGSRTERRLVAAEQGESRGLTAVWVRAVMRAPLAAILGVVVVLGVFALPALSLELALPNNGQQPKGTTARTAYDETAEHFGPGRNGTLLVEVDITQNDGFPKALERIRDRIGALPDVDAVGPATPNRSLDTAIMTVVPKSGPAAPATVRLVERIRALAPDLERAYETPVSVTGTTAVQIDISTRLGQAFLPFVLVVVGLSVLLLMAVFRSIVVPVKAAFGFLLSIAASLGITVAVFQWGWGANLVNAEAAPLLSFLPILVIAILFGLSMDYEVFIVSGMRETWVHSGDPRLAVRRGLLRSSRVVLAAALIMIFVFASFVPQGTGTIKPIAFALALGIFFDAFLVRTTLVPAVMTLAGRVGWALPRRLDRVLPVIDIEGEALVAGREQAEWADRQREWALSAEDLTARGADEPVSLHVAPGSVAMLPVAAAARRPVVAALAGHVPQRSGRLQVAGHPAPADAGLVRRRAAPVFDDGAAVTIGALLRERLRFVPRSRRTGSVADWLDRLSTALPQPPERGVDVGHRPLRAEVPLRSLAAEERLVVHCAAAIAGGAAVLVVDTGDIGEAAERRLAAALPALVDEMPPAAVTVVLVTTRDAGSAAPAARPLKKVATP